MWRGNSAIVALCKRGGTSRRVCPSGDTRWNQSSFSKVHGSGVTTANLRQAGVHIFSENNEVAEAEMLLRNLEAGTAA